uniref:Immunoglobulin V-set domain-containing protein n=1 Tax=Anser brachyrhynchus TaxID=132585 RepID=A0A8B9I330_9AVES
MHCSLLCLTANVPECFSRKSDIRAQGSLMLSCLAFCFQCSVCWPSLGAAGTVGREGTGINITCSHPDIQTCNYIHWYLQLPGQGPPFFVSSHKSSIPVVDPAGWLSVAADRRFSTLWLAQPRGLLVGYFFTNSDTQSFHFIISYQVISVPAWTSSQKFRSSSSPQS